MPGGGTAPASHRVELEHGLPWARRVELAAHWASRADCLEMVRARHPDIADAMVTALQDGGGANVVLQRVSLAVEIV